MADEGLLMEARLKDFISSNLKTIEMNLRNFSDVSKRELAKQTENNNQLNRSIGQVKGSWDVLGIATKQFIAVAGGLAIFTKIKSYLGECTSEIMKQVDAEAQLESAIGYTSKSLIDYAGQIQQTTTFEDDAVLQAQSRIASFIKEEDNIKAVTKAAVDFAAAKRIDVVTAADLLTKSIVSETNALSRYGIRIKDTNIVEERMKSAIEGVNKAYGGRAEALAKTDSGKIQQTNNLINEQKELIGKELLPVMREWYSMMLNFSKISVGPITTLLRGINMEIKLLKGASIETLKTDETIREAALKGGQEGASLVFDRLTKVNELYNTLLQKQKDFQGGKSIWNVDKKAIVDYEDQIKRLRSTLQGLTTVEVSAVRRETPKTTGKEDLEAKARADRQIKAHQEMVNAFWKNYNDLRLNEEKLNNERLKIQDEFQQQSLQLAFSKLEKESEILRQGNDRLKTLQIENSQQSLTGKLRNIQLEASTEIDFWNKHINDIALKEQLKNSIVKKSSLERIQIYTGEITQQSNMAGQLLGSWQSYLASKRNSEYQTEVERIKSKKLSQKEEEALLKQAEGRSREAAKKEQNISVGQALMYGGVAAMNALTVRPWPLALAAELFAIGQTAFQVATIKKQRFAKGGVVDTFLGEQGSEYVSGYGMVNKPTFASLPVGTRVYNNTETKNMFGGSTVVLNIPAGTPVDSRAADRIEDAARWIGDALVQAKREGRLVRYESMV